MLEREWSKMKQGTVVNRGTKQDTLDWLQETIDMLSRYKAEVEAGEIVIKSGDASVTSLDVEDHTSSNQNLLEIKLKDMDSTPEVYYKGERVFDKRLVSVDYQWEGEDESLGEQSIIISGYDVYGRNANKIPSLDTISHKRI